MKKNKSKNVNPNRIRKWNALNVLQKRIWIIVFILVPVFVLTAFFSMKKSVSEKELIEYLKDEENGLNKKEEIGDISIQVLYKPSNLLISQENKSRKEKGNNQLNFYHQNYYFILNLSKANHELEASLILEPGFDQSIEDLSFGMNKYISIVTSEKDTIMMKDYVYTRMYGGTQSSSFLLVFDKLRMEKAAWFDICIECPFLGVGNRKFRFKKSDIKSLPEIQSN